MNILYIHSHDTGRYIQPYGYGVPAPRLQRLAEEGVLFRQAFCVGPTCSPSRSALLTGTYPHENGMLGLSHRGWSLHDYNRTLIRHLQQHGYHCALSGIQHIDSIRSEDYGARIGYDAILDREDRQGGRYTWEHAADRAAEFLERAPHRPFFLDVGFFETHREFPHAGARAGRYVRPPTHIPDTPETRQDMADYIASAAALDRRVGQVLDALDAAGLRGDTLVISTTDHGIAFPGMKCNLTDHGTGVSLILRGPGVFSGGKVIDGMVTHMDLFPTICRAIGAEAPVGLRGGPLQPLVAGEVERLHEEIFFEVTYHAAYEPMRAIRTDRWKYIRRFHDFPAPVLPNCDGSPSKRVLLSAGWREQVVLREELYDLALDPSESVNRASDPSLEPMRADLQARLRAWMRETKDPLLNGPVPLPKGGVLTPQDAINPEDVQRRT